MRIYRQITTEERYIIAHLKRQGASKAAIARQLGRDRSTIWREFRRNCNWLGIYRAAKATEKTSGRRVRSRKKPQFDQEEFARVVEMLKQKWSPGQVSRRLRMRGEMRISHETIYRYVWKDKREGGHLYTLLRQACKRRRKRYGAHDSRGILQGKRPIEERPKSAEARSRRGHFEVDTVLGRGSAHCIMTLVDRKTGYVIIRKLRRRTTSETNAQLLQAIREQAVSVITITAGNGTEFHQYRQVEEATGVWFYFARPYHSWERGTNENTNGLIRQYLPKTTSMARLTQFGCDAIAAELNNRPRKRLLDIFLKR